MEGVGFNAPNLDPLRYLRTLVGTVVKADHKDRPLPAHGSRERARIYALKIDINWSPSANLHGAQIIDRKKDGAGDEYLLLDGVSGKNQNKLILGRFRTGDQGAHHTYFWTEPPEDTTKLSELDFNDLCWEAVEEDASIVEFFKVREED